MISSAWAERPPVKTYDRLPDFHLCSAGIACINSHNQHLRRSAYKNESILSNLLENELREERIIPSIKFCYGDFTNVLFSNSIMQKMLMRPQAELKTHKTFFMTL